MAAPSGSVLNPFTIPDANFDADFKNVTVPRAHTKVFFVRKNGTFETQDAKDGSPGDTDAAINGSTGVVTATKGKSGDAIFVVDCLTLGFFVKKVV